jgi:uridylate kinase
MGMIATVINGIAMNNALNFNNIPSRLMSSIPMNTICEPFSVNRACKHLDNNKVVIFVGGTGNPYFTTDTAATLRACETNCDILLKATKVKGVFSNDPLIDKNAQFIEKITYKEIFDKNIKVMDGTAIDMASENKLPIGVFSIYEKDLLSKIVQGKGEFTLVSSAN